MNTWDDTKYLICGQLMNGNELHQRNVALIDLGVGTLKWPWLMNVLYCGVSPMRRMEDCYRNAHSSRH